MTANGDSMNPFVDYTLVFRVGLPRRARNRKSTNATRWWDDKHSILGFFSILLAYMVKCIVRLRNLASGRVYCFLLSTERSPNAVSKCEIDSRSIVQSYCYYSFFEYCKVLKVC